MAARKILFYTHALTGGGAERVWALLATRFAEAGDDVIFAVDHTATENADFLDARVRSVVLGKGHLAAIGNLRRLIEAENPDIFLSAIGVSNLKMLAASALNGRLDRCIISLHGYFHSEGQPLSRIGNLITPIASRFCAATICVSNGLRQHVVTRWLLPAKKTFRIYNPVMVKMDVPPPSIADLSARPPIILAVGRLIHYKSYPTLIAAFAKVKTPGAKLQILGEGPERLAIETQIAALGLQDRVELLGYHSKPWSFYAQAKCFVLTSRSESFGNVIVEALANGLPVVSTKCHGPEEIILNRSLGRLVNIGDVDALARALDLTLANPGDPGPRIVRAKDFDSDTAFEAYEELIDDVIRRTQPLRLAVA
ncbi:MAG: glycosyltransferase [Beijerinckiaceae bacterium]|nr:glycosyltransferase [Beijerinckiaceae bacterium]